MIGFDKFGISKHYDKIIRSDQFAYAQFHRKRSVIMHRDTTWSFIDIASGNTRIGFLPIQVIINRQIYECIKRRKGNIFSEDRSVGEIASVRLAKNPLFLEESGHTPTTTESYLAESLEGFLSNINDCQDVSDYMSIRKFATNKLPIHQYKDIISCLDHILSRDDIAL